MCILTLLSLVGAEVAETVAVSWEANAPTWPRSLKEDTGLAQNVFERSRCRPQAVLSRLGLIFICIYIYGTYSIYIYTCKVYLTLRCFWWSRSRYKASRKHYSEVWEHSDHYKFWPLATSVMFPSKRVWEGHSAHTFSLPPSRPSSNTSGQQWGPPRTTCLAAIRYTQLLPGVAGVPSWL